MTTAKFKQANYVSSARDVSWLSPTGWISGSPELATEKAESVPWQEAPVSEGTGLLFC